MGTADFEGGSQGLRNHIEVDLVRRAGDGEATKPESYQFEGRWMTRWRPGSPTRERRIARR